jgi:hypothetical protein
VAARRHSYKLWILTGPTLRNFPLPRHSYPKGETSRCRANSVSHISLPPTDRDPQLSESLTCVSWFWLVQVPRACHFAKFSVQSFLPHAGSLYWVTLISSDPSQPHSLNLALLHESPAIQAVRIYNRCTTVDEPYQQHYSLVQSVRSGMVTI